MISLLHVGGMLVRLLVTSWRCCWGHVGDKSVTCWWYVGEVVGDMLEMLLSG